MSKLTERRALNNAGDWESLTKWVNEYREATAVFRQQSKREWMEFVAQKRHEEETVREYLGYSAFNIYLGRHKKHDF